MPMSFGTYLFARQGILYLLLFWLVAWLAIWSAELVRKKPPTSTPADAP